MNSGKALTGSQQQFNHLLAALSKSVTMAVMLSCPLACTKLQFQQSCTLILHCCWAAAITADNSQGELQGVQGNQRGPDQFGRQVL